MKLLHLADIHLDRAFPTAPPGVGERRRGELRDGFARALEIGVARGVDAICIAGDVYEHETVREDTAAFLRDRLAAARVPVLVAPGNHDPYVPGSVWQRTAWPANVHLFRHDRLEPVELPGGTVWGAAFTARHCSASCLRGWHAPAERAGHHGVGVRDVGPGRVACELVEVARRRYVAATVRVDGAAGSDQVETAIRTEAARHPGASLLVTLEGEVAPGCRLAPAALE